MAQNQEQKNEEEKDLKDQKEEAKPSISVIVKVPPLGGGGILKTGGK